MNEQEKQEWIELSIRLELGGNDEADVYEAQEFQKRMEEKYSKPFAELLKIWLDNPTKS